MAHLVIPSIQAHATFRPLQSVEISGRIVLSLGVGSVGSPEVMCIGPFFLQTSVILRFSPLSLGEGTPGVSI